MKIPSLKSSYAPGFNVHPIQARKAMEDQGSWRGGRLLHVGKTFVRVEVDGVEKRFDCFRAPQLAAALSAGEPLGGDQPMVVVIERWRVLLVPLGPKGSPPPKLISLFPSGSQLDGGAATEALTPDEGYQLHLYSIGTPEDRKRWVDDSGKKGSGRRGASRKKRVKK